MTTQSQTHGERPGVTVLGLGQMGTALANALLAAGHRTTVWNRTAGKADRLVDRGAVRADTVTDAVLASPLVIVCLLRYDDVHAVLGASTDALSGRALVNFTTGTPDEARAMADWSSGHGAQYLDGAMMAVPQTVATPEGFFLYSGSKDAFDTHRPTLDALAGSHFLDRDPGVAELWDVALLGAGYAALTGFLHSLALLDTAGATPAQFVPLVARWLHGMTAFMSDLAQEIESGDYRNGVSPVALNQVAVGNLVHVSNLQGIDAGPHAALRALLDRRVADGHGADSFSSLFELLRKQP
ncbi:NAD(P)-dependent oxidoreductase [Micromonospora sp. C51]|uniref:NAD(P)-dependent oxidoreductase n=1 Tax=Micromonospora sp. C51 TaxID=2824879 RepID=UPI001B395ECD|nr:NAD(P)-binding domain-containing protein [Micromonospora sp. C51]MBQ1047611.1 NAD(P)-dependent oxidoreductase [Micromonospora sp. C51]